ncbi:hypothetical protein [Salipiger bermudensis]|uniref:hypothetical protein n=1 Tax=Salipiger bermudensis TaxID=344736 RepID=UPI001CD729F1|nr:hypothetical protein [Salipiger bermudensis]MCA0964776.1 hypothetical protein [Salipiger bermudensis]
MHIDLIHAVIAAVLILGTLLVLRKMKITTAEGNRSFDWRVFVAVFAVMFVFNMLWPAGP